MPKRYFFLSLDRTQNVFGLQHPGTQSFPETSIIVLPGASSEEADKTKQQKLGLLSDRATGRANERCERRSTAWPHKSEKY